MPIPVGLNPPFSVPSYDPILETEPTAARLQALEIGIFRMYRRFPYPLGSELVQKAAFFAFDKHRDQRRKGQRQLPYFVHPLEVAVTLSWAGQDEYTVAAGFLHDVVEDCGVDPCELACLFGMRTAQIVAQVTNVTKKGDGPRAERQAREREHLSQAWAEARNLKLVDVTCNARDIVADEPAFAPTYLAEKRLLLPEIRLGSLPVLYKLACQAVGLAA
jgi:guanosine-3',5'-bis(diphosphate) 3'-pyrophosphohydrolase